MNSINPMLKGPKLEINPFWTRDLDEIEKEFLKGRNISTLPITLDDRVPPQGSVLLHRVKQPKRKFFEIMYDIFTRR